MKAKNDAPPLRLEWWPASHSCIISAGTIRPGAAMSTLTSSSTLAEIEAADEYDCLKKIRPIRASDWSDFSFPSGVALAESGQVRR